MKFAISRVRCCAALLVLSCAAAKVQAAPVLATKRTTLNHSTNTSAFFTLSVDGTSSFTGEDGWAPTAPTQGAVATSVTTKKSFSIVGDSTSVGNWIDGNRIPAGVTLAFDAELTIKALPAPGSYLTMPGANASVGASSRGIGVTQTFGPTGINDINLSAGLEFSAVTVSNVSFTGTPTETGFTFTPGGVANFGTTVFRSNVFQEANHGMVLTPINDPANTIGFGTATGTVASNLVMDNNFGGSGASSSVFARQTGPYTLMVTQGAGCIKGIAMDYDVTYDISTAGSVANADFNGDSTVDGADFLIWQRGSGIASGATLAQGDADGDGVVGPLDLEVWKTKFGGAATPAVAAVPEPTAALLMGAAVLSIVASRRRLAA
ncbi:hypothetical protein [Lacipirellula parvula]|uniref:PEP-CTERM protein-sorting domain-containing protein n=1 Tax=Lacipirellula parvula TaxID=2650471 RepID=A0A5K7XH38_9BACT|nr:hypothetical protein [Lacipirellula parvula]BBO36190.1 hypothetical protein PLANPX_5802 [Lacipirellula parvula]